LQRHGNQPGHRVLLYDISAKNSIGFSNAAHAADSGDYDNRTIVFSVASAPRWPPLDRTPAVDPRCLINAPREDEESFASAQGE
jgi:hypothetical protein